MNKLEKAMIVADTAHHGQKRKYNNEDYVQHCLRVYYTLFQYTKDEDMLAAALLHDTVEDTNLTIPFITRQFGGRTAHLVDELSNRKHPESLTRADKFNLNLKRLQAISPDGQTIKYCDIIDNTSDLMQHDSKWGSIYLAEKHLVLLSLDKGNPDLRQRAMDQIKGYLS